MINQIFEWIETNLQTLILGITTSGFGLSAVVTSIKKKLLSKKLTVSEEKNTNLQSQLIKISEKLDKVENKMVETVNLSTKTITGDVGVIGESMNKAYANSKSLSDKVKAEISTNLSTMNGLKGKADEIKNVATEAIKKVTKPLSVDSLKKQAALLQSGLLAKVLSEKEKLENELKEKVAEAKEQATLIEDKAIETKDNIKENITEAVTDAKQDLVEAIVKDEQNEQEEVIIENETIADTDTDIDIEPIEETEPIVDVDDNVNDDVDDDVDDNVENETEEYITD